MIMPVMPESKNGEHESTVLEQHVLVRFFGHEADNSRYFGRSDHFDRMILKLELKAMIFKDLQTGPLCRCAPVIYCYDTQNKFWFVALRRYMKHRAAQQRPFRKLMFRGIVQAISHTQSPIYMAS